MSTPSAYPLQWPQGWPETPGPQRERSRFKQTVHAALDNLQKQVRLMGGSNLILSSNCTLGNSRPANPGVVAYFEWAKAPRAIPCDRWNTVEANVQAIALTIEAMRKMESWGAKHMIQAMFSGFKALPAGNTSGRRPWWEVLGVPVNAPPNLVEIRYREEARNRHPDRGGSSEKMVELNLAMDDWKKAQGGAK